MREEVTNRDGWGRWDGEVLCNLLVLLSAERDLLCVLP